MAVKFTNNAKTTLASGINSSVTTATVTDGSVFPTLDAGEHFYCTFDDGTNNEIVKVTARSGNTLTIIRGVDNTTARSFSSGDAAELRATSALLTDIQENIAAKSANQTVYNTTTASSATDYDIGIDPSVEANAMVFLNGVMQHHDTFSFSGSTLTFDTAPPDGMALEVIVDNLINLQSSNLTVDTFTAVDVGGNPQTDFTLSDAPAAEDNLLVFIDGVFQDQDAYTISNQTLTITDGVTADFGVTVYVINPVNIGTPSDGTVTSSKLSGNITMPADLTVTGDVAFDSPTFVVDNANSRVGIGTASPSTLLDIVGDVNMSANLTVDTSTLVVDATNNRVGIGTDSPTGAKLQVQGDGVGIKLDGTANTTRSIFFRNTTSSNPAQIYSDGSLRLYTEDAGTDIRFHTVSNGTNNERMRIDSSGNVGIGVTSSYPLTVQSGTAGSNHAIALRNNSTNNLARLGFLQQDSATAAYTSIDGDGRSTGSLRFNTNDTERMRIQSNGEVEISGIGNTSGARLNIGSDANNAFVRSYDTAAGIVIGTTNAHPVKFMSNSSERMRIDSSGNLLVGTTSSTNTGKLRIQANTVSGGDSTALTLHQANFSNGGATLIKIGTEANNFAKSAIGFKRTDSFDRGSIIFCQENTADSSDVSSSDEKMRIDSSGNVTSPYTTGFQVTGTSAVVDQSSTGANAILSDKFNTAGGGGGHNIGNDYNTSTGIYTAPVDGRYLFGYNLRWETGDFVMNSYIRTYISINDGNDFQSGHQINGTNEAFTNFMAMSGSAIVSLSAGDTVRLKGGLNGGTGKFYASESSFYGILLS